MVILKIYLLIIGCNSDKAKDKIVQQGEKIKLHKVIEILQLEDSTRQTLTEMNSTRQKKYSPINYESYDKKKSKSKKKIQLILILLVLLLAGRNKILQVQASCATGARSPTPRIMKMSARLKMPSVMVVVSWDITR